jgi:3-deoxy-manno-octulosonate cytidylyltransferase (CMP-KDO synthetase)
MKVVAIIPARMGSSRFPGKPLAPLSGRPMIEHVYRRTAMSETLSGVRVATCDEEIREAVEAFGGAAIMTSDRHERASDRVAEAMDGLEADVVVMVQGDEPMVHPHMIDTAARALAEDPKIVCVNLFKRIETEADFENPNTIKVVMDGEGRALYFSRRPIPDRPSGDFAAITAYKQVCIMPFRGDALKTFAALSPTPLEIAESVDMMRFLEHGYPVHMVETSFETQAVDTPEDLARVEALMGDDPLLDSY